MIDKAVRQNHRAIFQPAIKHRFLSQKLGDMAAKSTDCALFNGDQNLMIRSQFKDHLPIQRLGKAGIGDGRDNPLGRQSFRRNTHLAQAGAK